MSIEASLQTVYEEAVNNTFSTLQTNFFLYKYFKFLRSNLSVIQKILLFVIFIIFIFILIMEYFVYNRKKKDEKDGIQFIFDIIKKIVSSLLQSFFVSYMLYMLSSTITEFGRNVLLQLETNEIVKKVEVKMQETAQTTIDISLYNILHTLRHSLRKSTGALKSSNAKEILNIISNNTTGLVQRANTT